MSQYRPPKSRTFELMPLSRVVPSKAINFFVYLFTLPYYRFFRINTLKPITHIAASTAAASHGPQLAGLVTRWRRRKISELQFISVACTVLAAAVIGSFSWNTIANPYWLSSASWYCSLVLAILGILLSAQQITVLEILGDPSKSALEQSQEDPEDTLQRLLRLLIKHRKAPTRLGDIEMQSTQVHHEGNWSAKWSMVFMWQCPIMFMAYSVSTYLLGLVLYITSPLIAGERSTDTATALVFLGVLAIVGGIFMLDAILIYSAADIEHESDLGIREVPQPSAVRAVERSTQTS